MTQKQPTEEISAAEADQVERPKQTLALPLLRLCLIISLTMARALPAAEAAPQATTASVSAPSSRRDAAVEKQIQFDGKPFLQGLIPVRGAMFRRYIFPVFPPSISGGLASNLGTLQARSGDASTLRILKGPVLIPEKARTIYRPSQFAMLHPVFLSGFSNGDINALALDLPQALQNTPPDKFPQSFCKMQSLKMIALDSLPSGPPDQVENLAVNFLNRFDRIDHLKVKVLLSPDACSRIKWLEGIHRFSVSSVTDLSTYLKVLKGVRQLDCLSIEKASLNKDDIQGIAKLTKLKTLQIVFQAGANPDAEKFQLLGKALPGCQIIPGTAANDDF